MTARVPPDAWRLSETPVQVCHGHEVLHVTSGYEIVAAVWMPATNGRQKCDVAAERHRNGRLIAAAPAMLDALDECDTAFAVCNISEGLTPQARAAVGEAWAKVQLAFMKIDPNSTYSIATREAKGSPLNLKQQRDALLQCCKELTVQIEHFIKGTLVQFPAALLPQAKAAIEACS